MNPCVKKLVTWASRGSAAVTNVYKCNIMMMRNVTGRDYCDCSSDSDIPLPCPEGDVFCDLIGKKRFQNKSSEVKNGLK